MVNFCVAILILNMEEKSNSFDMLCLIISTKVKMQLKHKNRREMYGEGIVTDQTWQSGLCSFVLEISCWTMLHGQVVEVDNDQIEALIEKNQCYIMQEIADILKISKSRFESHLHQLGYVNHFDV